MPDEPKRDPESASRAAAKAGSRQPHEAMVAAIAAMGVEVDAEEAIAWLTAVEAAGDEPGEFSLAEGIAGHELALLDFDPDSAGRLRRLGQIIGSPAAPDVETALAIAGSAAQGRIQPFPADVDFFERVHIHARTRSDATRRLAELVRADVLRVGQMPGFALDDVCFGRLPGRSDGQSSCRLGPSLKWTLPDVVSGTLNLRPPACLGPVGITWEEAAADPGFVKLSWFVNDRSLGGPVWVSKVVDPTWQRPGGTVASLDGAIDFDFQQVYLETDPAILAQRLTCYLAASGRERYLRAMEQEVVAHSRARAPNFGKVAKRLYNLCRLTARHPEALFLRELFDEPVARLCQVRATLAALMIECEHVPGAVCTGLSALLDDLAPSLSEDEACGQALAACREAAAAPTVCGLRQALAALDAALGAHVNQAFQKRLLEYPPTARLLKELSVRYPHA